MFAYRGLRITAILADSLLPLLVVVSGKIGSFKFIGRVATYYLLIDLDKVAEGKMGGLTLASILSDWIRGARNLDRHSRWRLALTIKDLSERERTNIQYRDLRQL